MSAMLHERPTDDKATAVFTRIRMQQQSHWKMSSNVKRLKAALSEAHVSDLTMLC